MNKSTQRAAIPERRGKCTLSRRRRRCHDEGAAAVVALVASEVRFSADYAAVALALLLFLAVSALLGRLLAARAPRPVAAALLLATSMRDFAIAAAIAAAAFGPQAAAPLGLYGVAILIWGTACAGFFRNAAEPKIV